MGRDINHFIFKSNTYIINIEEIDSFIEEDYEEGRRVLREHLVRERNPEVVRKAKENFKRINGRLYCEVCGFDFQSVYGKRGENYIEGHHKVWLSEHSEQRKTRIEDIAMLCGNCHRMIHRSPKITVEELKQCVTTER